MTHGPTRWFIALVFAAGAGGAAAQPCAGFTDVSAASGFCPNVEWVKNRSITLGCPGVNLYCPNELVARITMAAFMNRLGKALSPELLFVETGTGAVTLTDPPTPGALRCETADILAAPYPRAAIVTATLTGLADGTLAWRGSIIFSVDGGANYQGTPTQVGLRASALANEWSGIAPIATIAIAPNTQYRFGIGFRRDDQIPGTTGNFSQGRCQLIAQIVNQNGTSSPF